MVILFILTRITSYRGYAMYCLNDDIHLFEPVKVTLPSRFSFRLYATRFQCLVSASEKVNSQGYGISNFKRTKIIKLSDLIKKIHDEVILMPSLYCNRIGTVTWNTFFIFRDFSWVDMEFCFQNFRGPLLLQNLTDHHTVILSQ